MKHHPLFAPSRLPPARLEIPHERTAVVDLVVHLQRELLAARRTADKLFQQAHGGRSIAWAATPRYAKLRYRPLIFGSSPSMTARSSLPFDDATGDALCSRWGIPGGYHQLLGLCKLANLYPAPIADLPIEARSDDARHELLLQHLTAGLFRDRVVILVGAEAQRSLGYEPRADYLGPLDATQVHGARHVLAMPDPIRSPIWKDPRYSARALIIQALLAARLPVPARQAVTFARALSPLCPGDSNLHADDHAPEACLFELRPDRRGEALTWSELCRLGIATPRDLGAKAWWPIAETSTVELYLDRGHLRVTGHKDKPQIAEVIVAGEDTPIEATEFDSRASALRWCEDQAAQLGWTHPHEALDRRLSGVYGRAS